MLTYILAVNLLMAQAPDRALPACPVLAAEVDTYAFNLLRQFRTAYPGAKADISIGQIKCEDKSLVAVIALLIDISEEKFLGTISIVQFELGDNGKIKTTVLAVKEL